MARGLEVVRGLVSPLDAAPALGTWVPPAGEGVCAGCHAWCPPGRERCRACVHTAGQVSRPVPGIVPVSLFRTGDQLWHRLRSYKDAADVRVRAASQGDLARLLGPFLRYHLGCVAPGAPGDWGLVVVPPTRERAARHPLEQVVRRCPGLRRRLVRGLRTARPPEHNRARDDAFAVTGDVAGRSVVLLDDTWTTGASAQSAASALRGAGACVLGVVVIGRVLNPAAHPGEAHLWEWARRQPFRLDTCCAGPHDPPLGSRGGRLAALADPIGPAVLAGGSWLRRGAG